MISGSSKPIVTILRWANIKIQNYLNISYAIFSGVNLTLFLQQLHFINMQIILIV
jgi:hypothetical protein